MEIQIIASMKINYEIMKIKSETVSFFIIIIIHFVLLVYFLFSKNMFSIIYVIPAVLYKNSILSVILSCIFWYLGIKNFWELH